MGGCAACAGGGRLRESEPGSGKYMATVRREMPPHMERSDDGDNHTTRWPPDNYGPPIEDWEERLVVNVSSGARASFVAKVYSVLTAQMLLTVLIALPFVLLVDKARLEEHAALCRAASACGVALVVAVACCCQGALRSYPRNYLFLAAFTLVTGTAAGILCATCSLPAVAVAAGIAALLFGGLSAYAQCSGADFTGLGPYLVACSLGLVVLAGLSTFAGGGAERRISGAFTTIMGLSPAPATTLNGQSLMYATMGAILFCFCIIHDTQNVIGGYHRTFQFTVDEYAFAALSLHLDTLNLLSWSRSICRTPPSQAGPTSTATLPLPHGAYEQAPHDVP